jgi:RimJ/RimL family protein N-acetyltransferase
MGTHGELPPQPPPQESPQRTSVPTALRWVPVRSLSSRHRARILAHLLQLSERDRYLRFGYIATDAQIALYVDHLDFERDEVFGVFNRRIELVAMVHLAYAQDDSGRATSAEFGVSVSERLRGKGIGARLFDHAVLHARNRGVDTLMVHALTENTAMLRIARNAGAKVERSGGDSDAVLKLPPDDLASRLEEIVEGGAAEIDYSIKRQARHLDDFITALAQVSSRLSKGGKSSSE